MFAFIVPWQFCQWHQHKAWKTQSRIYEECDLEIFRILEIGDVHEHISLYKQLLSGWWCFQPQNWDDDPFHPRRRRFLFFSWVDTCGNHQISSTIYFPAVSGLFSFAGDRAATVRSQGKDHRGAHEFDRRDVCGMAWCWVNVGRIGKVLELEFCWLAGNLWQRFTGHCGWTDICSFTALESVV